MALTAEQIRHLARLAQLRLTDAEVERLTRELAGILDWIAMLDDLPLEEDKAQSGAGDAKAGGGAPLREDAPQPAPERKDLLRNAPAVDGAYFSVPKVVE
ncbi:MAG: Asp-tRNA(Asn)/Glu-tRNA(Gln) amidotransferase subunit GatC [Hyphomicrobiales bacterium]|nr:Asp-tRNA(Asn)/Glu-tRNA(Gln) amidotransferase subunit GatC [Hyphomicrobiales bacterium]